MSSVFNDDMLLRLVVAVEKIAETLSGDATNKPVENSENQLRNDAFTLVRNGAARTQAKLGKLLGVSQATIGRIDGIQDELLMAKAKHRANRAGMT